MRPRVSAPASSGPGRIRGLFVDLEPLRRDRDFRLLWTGQLISGFGRMVTAVALPYQLYVITGSTLAVGLLALVQLVPILVFALGGGAVADAVDRRRLLLLTQLGLTACSVALVGLSVLPSTPVVLLYAVAFVSAGLGAVDQPARARRSRGSSRGSGSRRRSPSASWASSPSGSSGRRSVASSSPPSGSPPPTPSTR